MRILLPLTAAVLLAAPAAAVNLVANGGFEADPNPGAYTQRNAGETTLTGWTIENGSVDHIGSYWNPASGFRSLDLNGETSGIISQQIATQIGRTYTFGFSYAGNPDNGIIKTMDYVVGSNTGNVTYTNTPNPLVWELLSFSFVADSALTTIRFSSTNPSAFGLALDDVFLTADVGVIPEPATWALLLAGFGMVGFAARRRRFASV